MVGSMAYLCLCVRSMHVIRCTVLIRHVPRKGTKNTPKRSSTQLFLFSSFPRFTHFNLTFSPALFSSCCAQLTTRSYRYRCVESYTTSRWVHYHPLLRQDSWRQKSESGQERREHVEGGSIGSRGALSNIPFCFANTGRR